MNSQNGYSSRYSAAQAPALAMTCEGLSEAFRAESRVRLRALLALGAASGPEGRKAIASQMRLVFRQMDATLARLSA